MSEIEKTLDLLRRTCANGVVGCHLSNDEAAALLDKYTGMQSALRDSLSRLTLARTVMRTHLRNGDDDVLDAWLLAERENGWIIACAKAVDAA